MSRKSTDTSIEEVTETYKLIQEKWFYTLTYSPTDPENSNFHRVLDQLGLRRYQLKNDAGTYINEWHIPIYNLKAVSVPKSSSSSSSNRLPPPQPRLSPEPAFMPSSPRDSSGNDRLYDINSIHIPSQLIYDRFLLRVKEYHDYLSQNFKIVTELKSSLLGLRFFEITFGTPKFSSFLIVADSDICAAEKVILDDLGVFVPIQTPAKQAWIITDDKMWIRVPDTDAKGFPVRIASSMASENDTSTVFTKKIGSTTYTYTRGDLFALRKKFDRNSQLDDGIFTIREYLGLRSEDSFFEISVNVNQGIYEKKFNLVRTYFEQMIAFNSLTTITNNFNGYVIDSTDGKGNFIVTGSFLLDPQIMEILKAKGYNASSDGVKFTKGVGFFTRITINNLHNYLSLGTSLDPMPTVNPYSGDIVKAVVGLNA
ncbi:unnamed protein product [Sphagnum balticum]